jgi:hypothetical protein
MYERVFLDPPGSRKLGVTILTVQRHIAAGTIKPPPVVEVGTVRVRLWSARDIERPEKS